MIIVLRKCCVGLAGPNLHLFLVMKLTLHHIFGMFPNLAYGRSLNHTRPTRWGFGGKDEKWRLHQYSPTSDPRNRAGQKTGQYCGSKKVAADQLACQHILVSTYGSLLYSEISGVGQPQKVSGSL